MRYFSNNKKKGINDPELAALYNFRNIYAYIRFLLSCLIEHNRSIKCFWTRNSMRDDDKNQIRMTKTKPGCKSSVHVKKARPVNSRRN